MTQQNDRLRKTLAAAMSEVLGTDFVPADYGMVLDLLDRNGFSITDRTQQSDALRQLIDVHGARAVDDIKQAVLDAVNEFIVTTTPMDPETFSHLIQKIEALRDG